MAVTRLVQNLIEAGLRADMQPLIRQSQHEQSRWQRSVRRLVTDEQDPLALLLTQPVNDKVRTACTAILAIPITTKAHRQKRHSSFWFVTPSQRQSGWGQPEVDCINPLPLETVIIPAKLMMGT